mgnify:CR=1 FL=1
MTNYETYESPFCTRYASEEMQFTFSAQKKFSTFRRLWVALARAEMKLGLEQVTQEKVDELTQRLLELQEQKQSIEVKQIMDAFRRSGKSMQELLTFLDV